jgi:CO/xanthine dehydrogenase FAD-binding subunit
VVRIQEAEKSLIGSRAADINIDAFKELIHPHIKPIDDQRSTAKYRKTVALNIAGDALGLLAAQLKGSTQ